MDYKAIASRTLARRRADQTDQPQTGRPIGNQAPRPNQPVHGLSVIKDMSLPGERIGRDCDGLYPHISRKLLAIRLGLEHTHVSKILLGKYKKLNLELACQIAEAVGVPVQQFRMDLASKRLERAKVKADKAAAVKAEAGSGSGSGTEPTKG